MDRSRLIPAMLVLTILGAMLMLPPLVYVFNQDIAHFGVRQIVFYLFALWLALIIGTALLARALPPEPADPDAGEGER
ncbi:hypothetical protein [Devosia sp. 1566]|uniref:hypothetical protein n=1 Tax=Devosia sp. 1566 TaxID=2499144 RepID=UPI000FD8FF0B|nr:hypothetical protein [Devosia sp. 1566]